MYIFSAFFDFYQNIYASLHTHVKNHHHLENYHNLNYPISFNKFIPFNFYIWKIVKTKSLSLVVKKCYFDCEYA